MGVVPSGKRGMLMTMGAVVEEGLSDKSDKIFYILH